MPFIGLTREPHPLAHLRHHSHRRARRRRRRRSPSQSRFLVALKPLLVVPVPAKTRKRRGGKSVCYSSTSCTSWAPYPSRACIQRSERAPRERAQLFHLSPTYSERGVLTTTHASRHHPSTTDPPPPHPYNGWRGRSDNMPGFRRPRVHSTTVDECQLAATYV